MNVDRKYVRLVMWLGLLATWAAVGMYAYLGTFSRYFADDYCEAVRVTRTLPWLAVLERYLAGATRASNRYSNLFFVGGSELLGSHSIPITIVALALLWCVGLVWSVHELRRYWRWSGSLAMDLFWGATLGFYSFLQAPNLFQSVLWRSAMMTHFAPLVFGSFLFAYVVRQLRVLQDAPLRRGTYAVVFVAAFIVAGFSEPPLTTMLTVLPLSMAAVWLWGQDLVKRKQLVLLAWAFAGAFVGFLTLAFSPASLNIAESRRIELWVLVGNTFYYSYLFSVDALKIAPVPVFISLALPGLWVWLEAQRTEGSAALIRARSIWWAVGAIPILMWLLIAAGFAPSVYGQNFPVERMRFLARTIVTIALMTEGMLFGLLLRGVRLPIGKPAVSQWIVLGVLVLLAGAYPLRAALNVYRQTMPEYRAHAQAWDLREASIRTAIAAGETDLVVKQLDSFGGALEYKGDARSWVNVCAAQYYGVNSIVAP